MRSKILQQIYLAAVLGLVFTACKKEGFQKSPVNTGHQIPNQSGETLKIKLQAVIAIGSIIYDSIPAQWNITSWDVNGVPYQKDTLLAAGVNVVNVPKAHVRYQFSVNKWGITDATMVTKGQIQEGVVYTLGGSKAAKKLRKEESFLFATDDYEPSSKILYSYNVKGLSSVEFYQKKTQYTDLQFTGKHLYDYSGSNVSRINVFDDANNATGFTEFTYNAQGTKIIYMHQNVHGVETYASVEHSFPIGREITIDYLFNNGNTMEYKMKINGGNKVEDMAVSSRGGSEGGTYKYDFNINPFAHMNMPDIFFSNLSKNNLIEQQKDYFGSIPSAEVYKYEYTYDNEGYPVEVVKHYKGYQNGEHLYKAKTVYTYM